MAVHHLIEEQARTRPSAVAVVSQAGALTYRRLNARANQLAHHLRDLGVKPGTPVGVLLPRGADLVVALLGVLKAGGANLPMDPEHPADRLSHLLRDSGAPVALTDGSLAGQLPASARPCLTETIADRPVTDPEPAAEPANTAYILYTSGSTGTPKGVVVSHRAIAGRVREISHQYRLTGDDVCLQSLSVCFDASIGEIFPTLAAGARLVVGSHDWNAARILADLRSHQVSLAQLPVSVWHELTARLRTGDRLPASFRLMLLGGEPVTPAALANWFDATPVPVLNLYGPTEATVTATTALITRPMTPVPIGRPIAGTEVFVLDRSGRPAPPGARGELWIGGPYLADGYLNQPGLTAERFVEKEVDGRTRRLYRTGDLAALTPDGDLEFHGRIDDQVKISGVRIEPGEITARLLAHPEVVSAATIVREDPPGRRRLVAYCQSGEDAALTVPAARRWCARFLPVHMIPDDFVFLPSLPLTSNGKVDRRALPAPGPAAREAAPFVAPRTEAERSIATVFQDVLGSDRIGVDDDFFAIGGDSVKSIQLVSRARDLGIRLNPRLVFEHPTVAELAALARFVPGPPAGRSRRFEAHHRPDGPGDTRVSLVHLNDGEAGCIAFCPHEIGGGVGHYTDLAAELAPVARTIGVESKAVAFGDEPDQDVCGMAAAYWRAIREYRPDVPRILVGYSFGGMLGLELTHLAEREGRPFGLLVVIDGCLPVQGARTMLRKDARAAAELVATLTDPESSDADLSADAAVRALLRAQNLPSELLSLPRDELVHRVRILDAHTRAGLAYAPRPTSTPVLLFQAKESPWPTPLADCWSGFAPRLDARIAPGDHLSVVRPPHVRDVAAIAKAVAASCVD